jgi:hypothetical protein
MGPPLQEALDFLDADAGGEVAGGELAEVGDALLAGGDHPTSEEGCQTLLPSLFA